jgi:hypothetical protein
LAGFCGHRRLRLLAAAASAATDDVSVFLGGGKVIANSFGMKLLFGLSGFLSKILDFSFKNLICIKSIE